MNRVVLAACLACGVAMTAAWSAHAQGKTTLDGVYSEAQAERGKKGSEDVCAGCHGFDFAGAPFVAPTLVGIPFVENWRDDTLASIYDKIRNDMPMGNPSRMSDADKLDVLTYILKFNEQPAGSAELTPGVLAGIIFQSKLPAQPVKDTDLGRVVGCLTKNGKDFVLVKATDPRRSREGLPSSEEPLKLAAGVPLGTRTFRLMDAIPSPDAFVGQRLDVKGILLLRPVDSAINVTALQTTGAACE